jgi:hypothetical protein
MVCESPIPVAVFHRDSMIFIERTQYIASVHRISWMRSATIVSLRCIGTNPQPLSPYTHVPLFALRTIASITAMFATASSIGVGTGVSSRIARASASP